jgi:hypothetical protein
MELFGIGIWEVLLIILIALIILGPQDTVKAGRNIGRAVRRFFSSPEWRALLEASREIRTIPDKLLEDTGLDHPEDILPSEAEIRQEAGLDDLEKNMAEWNADLAQMKSTGQAPNEQQTGSILPPRTTVAPAGKPVETSASQTGLDELEKDLSAWKADLSAWGSSKIIIPTPQTAAQAEAEIAAPPADETAPAALEQPDSEPPAQASAESPSPEQENT